MQSSAGDKQRLLHILKAIEETEGYVSGIDANAFLDNSLIKSGCAFQLQLIGEAANHLSDDLVNKYTETEWKQIVGTRNIIALFYWGIDYFTIWEIIEKKLPQLKEQVIKIMSELDNASINK